MDGELVTKLFIWISITAYVAAMAIVANQRQTTGVLHILRLLWTGAYLALLLHVLAAFATHHAWSHSAAVVHTAQQTEAVVGISFGGGVWFNYFLLLLWGADVTWWWGNQTSYENRSPAIGWFVHLYLAFIMFNAVIIFESGAVRWFGLGATALVIAIWFVSGRTNRNDATNE